MQAVKDSNRGKHIARRQSMSFVGEGQDRLYPRATIDVLPGNVLLGTFESYLSKDDADEFDHGHNYDGWQTLVHVCHRWRCIVFASPRRLGLKLYCSPRRLVDSKMLDVWPALPIVIFAGGVESKEDVTNVIAALRHHSRVCKIYSHNWRFQDPLLKEFAAVDEPFLALTSLELSSPRQQNVPVVPDSFLGGCAPDLRSLLLDGISYPSIGKLLSSTTNLVQLSLLHIPRSGYIPPEMIVPCLSMLPRLRSLELGFQYPRSRAHRASRRPPPLTRVVFPNLTSLFFRGDSEYLEDILSQIETPILNKCKIWLFNQLIFDTPLLGRFVRCTETFRKTSRARIIFFCPNVVVTLSGLEETADSDRNALWLQVSCGPLDWQLSALVQVLSSFLSLLQTLESLEILVSRSDWQGETEVIQWREILRPFTSVKTMTIIREDSVRLVAPALQEFAVGRATEVLPALQNIFLMVGGWQPSGSVKEAFDQFIALRQLSDHPVTVHY